MDTHGFLYNGTFDPLSPSTNLIMRDDDGAGNGQFKLTAFLEAGVPYILWLLQHIKQVLPEHIQLLQPVQMMLNSFQSIRYP